MGIGPPYPENLTWVAPPFRDFVEGWDSASLWTSHPSRLVFVIFPYSGWKDGDSG